jgi:pyridoxal phosphate enzyme (YggS family)
MHSRIAANYHRIQERIAQAAGRVGRDPASVRLVAVTKYAQIDWVRALVDLGCRDLGESRPQQLIERAEILGPEIRWHLIGHLQRNKVRRILPIVDLIHSVDSLRLLAEIERIAGDLSLRPRVLIEVNLIRDSKKHGFMQEELTSAWDQIAPHASPGGPLATQVQGLMAMAAFTENPEEARPAFRDLRQLRDRLAERSTGPIPELSMGMTGDFEVAIEEGATLVRIGSALWELLVAFPAENRHSGGS